MFKMLLYNVNTERQRWRNNKIYVTALCMFQGSPTESYDEFATSMSKYQWWNIRVSEKLRLLDSIVVVR